MQEVYKDFENREMELATRQEQFKVINEYASYFLTILHKDFNKESINFIKNASDLMKEEIREKTEELKAKQTQFDD